MHNASFYFYAQKGKKITLEEIEKALKLKLYTTDLRLAQTGVEQWLLTANKRVTSLAEVHRLDRWHRLLASRYACEYDGHEMEL